MIIDNNLDFIMIINNNFKDNTIYNYGQSQVGAQAYESKQPVSYGSRGNRSFRSLSAWSEESIEALVRVVAPLYLRICATSCRGRETSLKLERAACIGGQLNDRAMDFTVRRLFNSITPDKIGYAVNGTCMLAIWFDSNVTN